jgi:DNA-binding CsgD family transcriptional regulator
MGEYASWSEAHFAQRVAFTSREYDVMRLLMQGMSNERIARLLAISRRTVRFHLCNVFLKLAVENRTHAVSKAIQLGLVGSQGRILGREHLAAARVVCAHRDF